MDKKQKILIVEDDSLVASDLLFTLENCSYEVVGSVAYGEDVIKNVHELNPNLILMDINLAGDLDGIQTALAIQNVVDTPVVFLSALNDEATLQRAKLVNQFGYLIKPFEQSELLSTIELTLLRCSREDKNKNQSIESKYRNDDDELDLVEYASRDRALDLFSRLSVFNGISADELKNLSHSCAIREYSSGEFIVNEGQDAKGVFIPVSGRISVTKTAESGKELIVALLAPGDIFGLFYAIPTFSGSCSARSQITSKVISIPMSAWSFFTKSSPTFYVNLTSALAERLASAHTLSSNLAHSRVEGRIVDTLVSLLPEFGRINGKKLNEGRIFITRKELAELTGTTPETAIRITKNLEREGVLDLTRPGIIKISDINSLKFMHNSVY